MFPLFTGYGQCCIQILLLTTNCLRPTAANCCQLLPTPSLQDRRAGECIVTDNPPVEDGVIVIGGGGPHRDTLLLTYLPPGILLSISPHSRRSPTSCRPAGRPGYLGPEGHLSFSRRTVLVMRRRLQSAGLSQMMVSEPVWGRYDRISRFQSTGNLF